MNQPRVSVAMTTYNGEVFLRQQLDSLLAQDYAHLEIVICDDCSTDNTWAILEKYAANHAGVRVFRNDTQLGFNENFLQCFARCRGDLISPCDQDDIWNPRKTCRLVDTMVGEEIVYCDSTFVDQDGQPIVGSMSTVSKMYSGSDPRRLLLSNTASGHAMLFPRSLLRLMPSVPDGAFFDWWLLFVATSHGVNVRYLDEALVSYRRHDSAVTTQHQDYASRKREKLSRQFKLLNAFSRHPGPAQALAQDLLLNWHRWYWGWLCWPMAWLMWHNRDVLFDVQGRPQPNWWRALAWLPGYQLKRWLSPQRYPELAIIPDADQAPIKRSD